HDNIARSERLNFMQTKVLHTLDESIVYSLGITQVLPFEKGDATKFELIRDSNSLFELYRVLTGASQFVLGTVSARRQGELLSLKSYGNLSPNLNPFDDDNKNLEYSLVFKLKKSGNGGNISSNKTIERPITTSIAKIIWRLEEFNKRAISLGIFKGKTLTLFSTLTASTCTLSKSTKSAYNERLDNLCDYFETDLVLYDNGEFRRNYVRQHQLRRFFALLFF
ncbi:integrase, partial [Vibrio parahaemolyticus]